MAEVSRAPATDEPVEHFSQCHVGIVSRLQELGHLPALVDPMRRAREIASQTLRFFHEAVIEHHAEEEQELFPAVLASAAKGAERERVQAMVDRLTAEHRSVEGRFSRLEPALKKIAKGEPADIDAQAVADLVTDYVGHARFEEQHFLPLSQAILGRNGNHMAALGISLHMRQAMPEVLRKVGFRI